MKTKLNFSVLLIIVSLFVFKNANSQITKSEIEKAGKNFIKKNSAKANTFFISQTKTLSNKKQTIGFVSELKPQGFIVFSSSKQLAPVIAYSFRDNFNFNESAENVLLSMLKQDLGCQLSSLNKKITAEAKTKIKKNTKEWEKLIKGNVLYAKTDYEYGPLLNDVWGGVNCYDDNGNIVYTGNYFTPNHYSPGCVATSLSQILHHFEWPKSGTSSHTNYDNSGSSQKNYYVNFAAHTYDWDNMLDEYMNKPSTDTERRAMGKLAYHCGVALDMDYESYASTSNINKSPNALSSYFRHTGHYETASWYYFWPRLRENIENNAPVQLAIYASNGAGHAIVCDGYRYNTGEDKYYHLNMGWWGTCNAWYRIQGSFNSCGYSIIDGGVFDIFPKPKMDTIYRSTNEKVFDITWKVSKNLNWEAFELQQQFNGGMWTTVSNSISDTIYTISVNNAGTYKYRVKAKIDGNFYLNSFSDEISVNVKDDLVFLDFDGNDSFFVNDNSDNNLDLNSDWTIEAWTKIDLHTSGEYAVILDRKTVFSCYIIDDSNADYAIRFVARNLSGSIIASLRSDNSSVNLNYAEWVHVAVSRDNGTARFFLNGNLVESSSDTDFNLTSSTNALNVGARYWSGYERYLNGKLDEIRLSDIGRYTSNFEISRANELGYDSNTMLYMNLNEGEGSEITDITGNFSSTGLRSSPNMPNWGFEELTQSGIMLSTKIETAPNSSFKIYPNPVSETLNFEIYSNKTQNMQLIFFSPEGKVNKAGSFNLQKGENTIIQNVSNFEKGLYFVKSIIGNSTCTQKMIIE